MNSLERQLRQLSLAVFEETLEESRDPKRVLGLLENGAGPLTLTLRSEGDGVESHALVLHALKGDEVVIFDPNHTFVNGSTGSGSATVSSQKLVSWFQHNQAMCLVPKEH